MRWTRRVSLVPTEMFEELSAEFDFERRINISPIISLSFNEEFEKIIKQQQE